MFKHHVAHTKENWKQLNVGKRHDGSIKVHLESHNWTENKEIDFTLDEDFVDQLLLELVGEDVLERIYLVRGEQ